MALVTDICKKAILIIITISILIMFCATPASYAKLDIKDGDFYYSGTTKGTYTVHEGVFAWLLNHIGDIADWLLGIITMGFRMVFVGWTALVEKLLTWALETTTGVNVAGEDISSTDLTSLTDSSNNVTIQAIVYNQVPALNINFFDLSYDKSISGTGQEYRCEKCNKLAKECISEETKTCNSECKCDGKCNGCKSYIEALNIDIATNPPIVMQVKNLVSMWYYVIRLIAVAAMLVVLIVVGIKMAISTIASDKAVYKRMLVDWIVGVIILFAIHYMMIFVIYINEALVDVIKNSANSVNEVTLKHLSLDEDITQKTDGDIEIDIYEAVRTRAYDAKLSVGLSGMIMYMTLVYFAIRYTLVYLKRYLTLIVLTLMGPAVGFAYAIQKVISGKSSALKNWTSEYVMNVIIQTVHALIYAVFISTALVLSLQSIPGMIVALIFMNYSLKADALFRKIFKFGDGNSLLGHTAEAGSAEKIRKSMQTARGLYMGAKPLAKTMMNTPISNAVKGAGKVAVAAGISATAGGVKLAQRALPSKGERFNKAVDKEMDRHGEGAEYKENETEEQYEERRSIAEQAVLRKKPRFREETRFPGELEKDQTDAALIVAGETKLRNNIVTATSELASHKKDTDEYSAAKGKYNKAIADYARYKEVIGEPSTKQIIKAHAENLIDVENHFKFNKDAQGKIAFDKENLKKLKEGIFGTQHRDYKTKKMVSDKNGLYNQLSSKNLLGFTDADKKIFKSEVLTPIRNGLGGMASMFFGLGTIVAHPQMGMALLGAGAALTNKTFKKPANSKGYKGRYSFSRFSAPAVKSIQKAAVKRANRELDSLVVDNVKQNHSKLYQGLKDDLENDAKIGYAADKIKDLKNAGLSAVTVGTLGLAAGAGVAFVPMAMAGASGFMARFAVNHTGVSANLKKINKHAIKQARSQQLEFIKDGEQLQMATTMGEMEAEHERQEEEYKKKAYEAFGYRYDEKTGQFVRDEDPLEEYNKVIIALYAEQGLKYDPRTGTTTPINNNPDEDVDIKEDELVLTDKNGTPSKISDSANQDKLNRELDAVIAEMLKNTDSLDTSSQAIQNELINKLSVKLEKAGIIEKNQKVEDIFKNGKSGIVDVFKRKVDKAESVSKLELLDILKNLDEKEKTSIQQVSEKLSEGQENYDNLKTEDVLEQLSKMQSSLGMKDSTKLEKTIDTYILSLQKSQKKPAKDLDSVKLKVDKKVSSRRKKLNQVLSLDLDGLSDQTVDDAIDMVASGKASVSGERLSSDESSDVLELLLMRKELEEINKYARKELELKSGNIGYTQRLKNKSADAVAYYGARLEVESYKRDDSMGGTYIENLENKRLLLQADGKSTREIEIALNSQARKDLQEYEKLLKQTAPQMREEEIMQKILKLQTVQKQEMSLESKESKMKKSEREIDTFGPIENVNDFIKKLERK